MSGASHVAIAGVAENQEKINPASGEPIGTSGKPETKDQPAGEEQQKNDAGNPKKVPSRSHDDGDSKEVETEGTFLGLNGHDWMVGGIGAAVGAAVVGAAWAICSGD